MNLKFYRDVTYAEGLAHQAEALSIVNRNSKTMFILGLEHRPTVTLGLRSTDDDLILPDKFAAQGFVVAKADRGGQAALHMPGQLVIYPVLNLREHQLTVKSWICLLAAASTQTFAKMGIESRWSSERPGVYSQRGKLVAFGVRIRNKINQHGICINVCNSLEPYEWLVPCGHRGLAQDSLSSWSISLTPEELFPHWVSEFTKLLGKL